MKALMSGWLILGAAFNMVGCGEEEKADKEDAVTGTVTGTFTYAGAEVGTVYAVLYAAPFNPSAPPAAFEQLGTTFPATYALADVAEGEWLVGCLFDVGSNITTAPTAEDKVALSETFTVAEGSVEFVRDVVVND